MLIIEISLTDHTYSNYVIDLQVRFTLREDLDLMVLHFWILFDEIQLQWLHCELY